MADRAALRQRRQELEKRISNRSAILLSRLKAVTQMDAGKPRYNADIPVASCPRRGVILLSSDFGRVHPRTVALLIAADSTGQTSDRNSPSELHTDRCEHRTGRAQVRQQATGIDPRQITWTNRGPIASVRNVIHR